MKIKRFEADDMRSALRQVQEDLGADAVILSTESRAGGVCMIAALDYDEALISPVQSQLLAAPEPQATAPPAPRSEEGRLDQIEADLSTIRELLNARQAHSVLREPQREDQADSGGSCSSILRKIGVDEQLATELQAEVPHEQPGGASVLARLAHRLDVDCEALRTAPALVLVGPTGSGKTTTLAKIASRHLMRNPGSPIRFVCTDDYRIGGREQLQTYARLLGASVQTTSDMEELREILSCHDARELILVDTPGIGARDGMLAGQLPMLGRMDAVVSMLCLPAPVHPLDQRAVLRRYAPANPRAIVLTKVDETARLGMGLCTAIESGLPIAWITDGQRVPHDLHALSADDLIARAVARAEEGNCDPSLETDSASSDQEARRVCA